MMGLGGTVEPEGSGWDYPSVSSFEDEERRRREAREALDAQLGGAGLADVAELERRSARRRAIEAATGSPAALSSLATAPQEDVRYSQALERAKTAAGLPSKPAAMVDGLAMGASGDDRTERMRRIRAASGDAVALEALLTPPSLDVRQPPVHRPQSEALEEALTRPGPDVRPPPTIMRPTPEGEALFDDLRDAGLAQRTRERLSSPEGPPPPPTEPALPEGHWMRRAGAAIGRGAASLGRSLVGLADDPDRKEWWDAPGSMSPAPPVMPPTTSAPAAAIIPPAPRLPSPPVSKRPAARPRVELEAPPNFTMQVPATPYADEGPLPADHPAVARALETARPTARQGPTDLDAALQSGADRRLLAGLVRAGGTAIGRGRGPGYDALDAEADRPLAELSLRRGEAQRVASETQAASDADPTSPQSAMARALVAKVLPGVERESWFAGASYARLSSGPLAKLLDMNTELQRERIKAQAEIDKTRASRGAGGAGFKEADVQKLGKDTEGLARIKADVQMLEQLANLPAGTDIPGAGVLDTRKPGFMQSQQDTDAYQATLRVAAELLHQQSGASVTPQEAERFLESRGMGKGTTEQQFRAGAKALVRDLRAEVAAKTAKYSPATRREATTRGVIMGLEPGAPAAPAPGGGGWTDADEQRLQELEAKSRAGRLR